MKKFISVLLIFCFLFSQGTINAKAFAEGSRAISYGVLNNSFEQPNTGEWGLYSSDGSNGITSDQSYDGASSMGIVNGATQFTSMWQTINLGQAGGPAAGDKVKLHVALKGDGSNTGSVFIKLEAVAAGGAKTTLTSKEITAVPANWTVFTTNQVTIPNQVSINVLIEYHTTGTVYTDEIILEEIVIIQTPQVNLAENYGVVNYSYEQANTGEWGLYSSDGSNGITSAEGREGSRSMGITNGASAYTAMWQNILLGQPNGPSYNDKVKLYVSLKGDGGNSGSVSIKIEAVDSGGGKTTLTTKEVTSLSDDWVVAVTDAVIIPDQASINILIEYFTTGTVYTDEVILEKISTEPVDSTQRLGTIEGTLEDSGGAPIQGYDIVLNSAPVTKITDSAGRYVFSSVEYTNHRIDIINTNNYLVGQYNINFSPGASADYTVTGQNISIVYEQRTRAVSIAFVYDGTGTAAIGGITFTETVNPRTGERAPYLVYAILIMFIVLTCSVGFALSKRCSNKNI